MTECTAADERPALNDRLRELYSMLAQCRAMTAEIERRIATEEEHVPAEALVARRRRGIHAVA
jgi:hypothetical protein